MNVIFTCNGTERTVKAVGGENLMKLLVENGCAVQSPCGGRGTCGKCRAKLIFAEQEITTDEQGHFLLCQTTVRGDISFVVYTVTGNGLTASNTVTTQSDGENGVGIALDIGTTTIAAYLMDLKTGRQLCEFSRLNPQHSYGADVLTRIQCCTEGKLQDLKDLVVSAVREIIENFKIGNHIDRIARLTVAANTTMLHIFLGVDPTPIGISPFTPPFLKTQRLPGKRLGLAVDEIVLLPSASAYVGADITAGMVACNLADGDMLVDIGTNGEMALVYGGRKFSCSTAAGPAFEGANISCGTGGIVGAISRVRLENGDITFETIGKKPPIGICGAGLIDLAAVLVEAGIIDETGAFDFCRNTLLNKRLAGDRFFLTDSVYLSQKDVRQLQLAKSAIASGITSLLHSAGCDYGDIKNLYVAGGFGFYADMHSAAVIGLIPKQLESAVKQMGNTAGAGAILCLLSREKFAECEELSESLENVDLAANDEFMSLYVDNMMF